MIHIQESKPLGNLCTFHIGGNAKYYVAAQTEDDVLEALSWAHSKQCKVLILGGGSNVLFPDEGFDGLVIKISITRLVFDDTKVSVGAGVLLADLITQSLDNGLVGMEFAAGIPGTVGGAIRGNAGTFGVDMSSVVNIVTYLPEDSTTLRTIAASECSFGYRHSMFKQHNHVILSAELMLQRGDVDVSRRLIEERIQKRHAQHPVQPSAGCIFKNIPFASLDDRAKRMLKDDLDKFSQFQKIPTGFLIEQLGLKGKTIGGAQISSQHANYIINNGTARYNDVITLMSYIKQQVRDTYGVQLEEEVQIVYND